MKVKIIILKKISLLDVRTSETRTGSEFPLMLFLDVVKGTTSKFFDIENNEFLR